MNSIFLRMVFNFYTFDGFLENEANQVHLKCLKKYSKLFDEIIMVISMDDVNDRKLELKTKKTLIETLNCKRITFKVIKNTEYREALTFYTEIIQKLGNLYGLTFFAHNKGITNINDYPKKNILEWICGMYFLNLEYLKEVESDLMNRRFFWGGFLVQNDDVNNKFHVEYQGTFYWINCIALNEDLKLRNVSIPMIDDRAYAEEFPGSLYGWEKEDKTRIGSVNYRILYNVDTYFNIDEGIRFYLMDEQYKEYDNFKNEIL